MNLKRLTAAITLVTLVLGAVAAPALADRNVGPVDKEQARARISEKYADMGEFQWGLNEVTKMSVKGIFKGRADSIFAPGAKITHQETAVATVRLMDKEAEALAMTAAQVDAQLAGMPDQAAIAVWARPAVATLAELGVISKTKAFEPLADSTRLEIAVVLVKALGYHAEAIAKANAKLDFKDAHLIPSEYTGHVAVAVDRKLITGYEDSTFRPHQAVKRVELAVMMGRADRLIDKEKQDEYKGVIKSVNATAGTFVITVVDHDVTLKQAADASIFVNNQEKGLADLAVGMKVEVKLNAAGEVIYVEAKSPETTPAEAQITGTIEALTPAAALSLALININGTAYPVSPRAVLKVNNQPAIFADLKVGDTVRAMTLLGVIVKLEAQRDVTSVRGTVTNLVAASQNAPAKITLTFPSLTTPAATAEYTLAANATVTVNAAAAQFADLRVGDTATLTLSGGLVTKVQAERAATTVSGTIERLAAATSAVPAQLGLKAQGATTVTMYSIPATAAIRINGVTATFADLRTGDNATVTLASGVVDKVEVTRTNEIVIEGTVTGLNAAAAGTNFLGQVSIGYTLNGAFTLVSYNIPQNTPIRVSGQAATFADLRLNDHAKATLLANTLIKLEVTR